jgi:hypothetical protein
LICHEDNILSADELQLKAQGHVSKLPRQFSLFSTLALAFSITNTGIEYLFLCLLDLGEQSFVT